MILHYALHFGNYKEVIENDSSTSRGNTIQCEWNMAGNFDDPILSMLRYLSSESGECMQLEILTNWKGEHVVECTCIPQVASSPLPYVEFPIGRSRLACRKWRNNKFELEGIISFSLGKSSIKFRLLIRHHQIWVFG